MNHKFASIFDRFLAFLIDSVVVILVSTVIGLLILYTFSKLFGVDPNSFQSITNTMIVFPVIVFLYFPLMESSKYNGTFGKKVLGIKVFDVNLRRISFRRALMRTLGKIISSIGFIGFLAIAFSKNKQAFHDFFSGCLVFKIEE